MQTNREWSMYLHPCPSGFSRTSRYCVLIFIKRSYFQSHFHVFYLWGLIHRRWWELNIPAFEIVIIFFGVLLAYKAKVLTVNILPAPIFQISPFCRVCCYWIHCQNQKNSFSQMHIASQYYSFSSFLWLSWSVSAP